MPSPYGRKRQPMPKIQKALPPEPEPPRTRDEVKASLVQYLTNRTERAEDMVRTWKEEIANATAPSRFVDRLAWSATVFEHAGQWLVYSNVLRALTDEDSNATVATVAEFTRREALSRGRRGSRSTSTISNEMDAYTLAAYAMVAEELESWAKEWVSATDDSPKLEVG